MMEIYITGKLRERERERRYLYGEMGGKRNITLSSYYTPYSSLYESMRLFHRWAIVILPSDDKGRGDLSSAWKCFRELATCEKSFHNNSDRMIIVPLWVLIRKYYSLAANGALWKKHLQASCRYQTLIDQRNSILNGQSNIYWIKLDKVFGRV